MTPEMSGTLFEAARLIRIALNPRETPARNAEYQQLLARFHTDAEFREVARSIGRGLDLQIYELAREFGLAMVNIADGPYSPKADDFRRGMKPAERIIYGLLIATVAAYVYPTKRALGEIGDSTVVSIELKPLVEWISSVSRDMQSAAELDDVAHSDLRRGFDVLALIAPFGEGNDTLRYRVEFVLGWLVEQGLFKRDEQPNRILWTARPHFRVEVRHLLQGTHDFLVKALAARAAAAAGVTE